MENNILKKYDINTNSHLEYLWYKIKGNYVIFEWKYYENYLVNYLEDNNIDVIINGNICKIKIEEDYMIDKNGDKICKINKMYDIYVYAYNAENWYEEVKDFCLCEMHFIEITKDDLKMLKEYKFSSLLLKLNNFLSII